MVPKAMARCPCSCGLLLQRQKREGFGWLVAIALCPALGRHRAAQARRAASTAEWQLLFVTGLPVLKACPCLRTAAGSSLF